jgi:hypothetical protein
MGETAGMRSVLTKNQRNAGGIPMKLSKVIEGYCISKSAGGYSPETIARHRYIFSHM